MAEQAAMDKVTIRKDGGGEAAQRRRSVFVMEFTTVFAWGALILVLAVVVGVTSFLASDIRAKTLTQERTEMAEVVAPRVASSLSPEALQAPLEGEALAAFDAEVRDEILSSRTVRLNVFNTEGVLVYSSAGEVPGEVAADHDRVRAALQGETVSWVGQPRTAGDAVTASSNDLVGILVPLTAGDPPQTVGVVEVYRDYGPVAAHITAVLKSVFISIVVALAVLYLALVLLVRRGSKVIRRQQADLEKRTEELKSSYDSIIAVLCSALDLRDNVALGHARRVSELASVVAWQMGLRKEEVRRIENAAILHDIGKIGVADAVLSKAGPLDKVEWEEMKRHPELGHQILRGIDFLHDEAEVVYAHHERYDGSGYPRGLKGDEIPLGARIFAVVDAYDAVTTHRPYRKGSPHQKAVEEIMRNSGTQFDPQVVRAFLEAEKRGLLETGPRDGHREIGPTAVEAQARTSSPAGD